MVTVLDGYLQLHIAISYHSGTCFTQSFQKINPISLFPHLPDKRIFNSQTESIMPEARTAMFATFAALPTNSLRHYGSELSKAFHYSLYHQLGTSASSHNINPLPCPSPLSMFIQSSILNLLNQRDKFATTQPYPLIPTYRPLQIMSSSHSRCSYTASFTVRHFLRRYFALLPWLAFLLYISVNHPLHVLP
jgi:hypothetical protein